MFIIIGFVVVTGSVVVGFLMAGGDLHLLIQPSEFVTIGGAALGSLLISSDIGLIKRMVGAIPKAMTNKAYHKHDYLELLKSLNDLFLLAQRDGVLALETHVENPEQSDILSKNKKFLANEIAKTFFCDTLKVMLSGGVPPHELEILADNEIDTFKEENHPVSANIAMVADALPGLGIVAAVLGIIVTMASISDGPEVVGHHVAAALVGTFLGVLLSYGYLNPLATNIGHMFEHKAQYLVTIKTCLVAYAKGNPPIVAVEMARRTINSDHRPSFGELEGFIRGK